MKGDTMRIVVMPGDDIGPEITAVTMTMLEAVNRTHALGMVTAVISGPISSPGMTTIRMVSPFIALKVT